jgi:hypothetical protein
MSIFPTSSLEFNSWERNSMQEGGREKKKKKASPSVFILWKRHDVTHMLVQIHIPYQET